MLFRCIRRNLETAGKWNNVVEQMWTRIRFAEAFNKWPKRLVGVPFPKTQPFSAARVLAARRNATVHKDTLAMARSALYTGVQASRAIQAHFEDGGFAYAAVIEKYPVDEEKYLCDAVIAPPPPRTDIGVARQSNVSATSAVETAKCKT